MSSKGISSASLTAGLRGDFPQFCRQACTVDSKGLGGRNFLNQAMSEEHEFIHKIPTRSGREDCCDH